MKNSRRRWASIVTAGLALAVTGWVALRPNGGLDPTPPTAAATTPPPKAAAMRPVSVTPDGSAADAEPLIMSAFAPAVLAAIAQTSLRGTQPDGAVRFGSDGRLIVDQQLRQHLDWWLTLLGEVPLSRIRQLLQANLAGLDPAQTAQALAFFDRWTDYLQAADALPSAANTSDRLAQLSALRRRWFGDDAPSLFADEEAYTQAILARLDALNDPSLSPEQRAKAVAQAESQLSDEQQKMRSDSTQPLLASVQTAQFDALAIPPDQRQAERSALWGPEAAERLAELDQQRGQWQARMQAFAAERQQILSDSSLQPLQRQERIQMLLERDFTEAEARRAQALLNLPPGTLEN